MKWSIGCDPELVLMNPNSGEYVSAEGIVPGNKLNPHKVNKGTIQVDGFAAEIGIDPASSAEEFADNVETVLEELKKYTGGYLHVFEDSVIFSDAVYKAQSDKGKELGCDPDYCAYTGGINKSPVPNPISFRTFAGHIHVGWGKDMDITDPGHFADAIAVAKQMDWSLGVPNVVMNPNSKRRVLYGQAGAFRVKSYGMEHRTPDNSWLRSRNYMKLMFNNAAKGMDDLYAGKHYASTWNATGFINKTSALSSIPQYLKDLGLAIPRVPTQPKVAVKSPTISTNTQKIAVNG